jgi:two-component system, NarL family, invasion response regulator UvrY
MTSVLLVDDHPIVLQGCRRILEEIGTCEVREASTLASAYRFFAKVAPDLAILDLGMEGRSLGGIALIEQIRREHQKCAILVFSVHNDPSIVRSAFDAGANGYILKDTSPTEFRNAIRKVLNGRTYLAHELATEMALLGTSKQPDQLNKLTSRELEVLTLLAEGHQYGSIAGKLGVSYKTVANGCTQLKAKLGAATLPQLIRIAVKALQ